MADRDNKSAFSPSVRIVSCWFRPVMRLDDRIFITKPSVGAQPNLPSPACAACWACSDNMSHVASDAFCLDTDFSRIVLVVLWPLVQVNITKRLRSVRASGNGEHYRVTGRESARTGQWSVSDRSCRLKFTQTCTYTHLSEQIESRSLCLCV